MTRRNLIAFAAIMITVLAAFPAYAHDIEWGIRHGEQDALVLGTVKEAGEDWVVLEDIIPLPSDGDTTIYRQLEPDQIPDTMKVTNVQPYALSYHNRSQAQPGDHMMVSADKDGDLWKALYRPYEVSSLDTASLEFLPEGRKNGDSAAWEAFVHSGGVYSEFSFGEGEVSVRVKRDDGTEERMVVFEEETAAVAAAETAEAETNTAAPGPEAAVPEKDPSAPESAADSIADSTAVSTAAPASTDTALPSGGGISPLALGCLWGGAGFLAAFIFARRKKK